MYSADSIEQKVKDFLTESRFKHTLRVYDTALHIIQHKKSNGTLKKKISIQNLKIAILLHDIAKKYNPETIIEIGIQPKDSKKDLYSNYPNIWHAFIAPTIARQRFKVTDADILEAITLHTTGNEKMSELSMLVFIADYVEPGRKFEISEWIIQIAIENLESAVYIVSKITISYLNKKNIKIHENTLECYAYYNSILDKQVKEHSDSQIETYNTT